jgi:hypothetical protein
MSDEWAGVVAALVIAILIAVVIAWLWLVWVVIGMALLYFGIENIFVQVFCWVVVNAILGKLSR